MLAEAKLDSWPLLKPLRWRPRVLQIRMLGKSKQLCNNNLKLKQLLKRQRRNRLLIRLSKPLQSSLQLQPLSRLKQPMCRSKLNQLQFLSRKPKSKPSFHRPSQHRCLPLQQSLLWSRQSKSPLQHPSHLKNQCQPPIQKSNHWSKSTRKNYLKPNLQIKSSALTPFKWSQLLKLN